MTYHMRCDYYTIGGVPLDSGSFSINTKSLYKAAIDAQEITRMKVIRFSFNWALLGDDKGRLLVSVVR